MCGPKPKFVPGYEEGGAQPAGIMKWNAASFCWEYYMEGERQPAFVFSDFGLKMIASQFRHGEDTGRVEIVVGVHSGALVLRSVPLSKLRGFIKEEYGVDISQELPSSSNEGEDDE